MHRYLGYFARLWRAKDGIASIEFVLIFPILMLLLTLATDFGRLYYDYHAVSKSVRDATRYLTRVEGSTLGLNIDCDSETLVENTDPGKTLVENARRLAMTGRFDGNPVTEPLVASWTAASLTSAATGIVVTVECLDNPDGAVTYEGFYEFATKIPSVIMTAEVPFRFQLAQMFQIGPDITFTVRHKMAHFGT